jgi:hypothetical protein
MSIDPRDPDPLMDIPNVDNRPDQAVDPEMSIQLDSFHAVEILDESGDGDEHFQVNSTRDVIGPTVKYAEQNPHSIHILNTSRDLHFLGTCVFIQAEFQTKV